MGVVGKEETLTKSSLSPSSTILEIKEDTKEIGGNIFKDPINVNDAPLHN